MSERTIWEEFDEEGLDHAELENIAKEAVEFLLQAVPSLAGAKDANLDELASDDDLEMKLTLYRGGDFFPKEGEAWFTSSIIFAKTYGPVHLYEIKCEKIKDVDLEEWYSKCESYAVRLSPEGATALVSEGYQGAVVKIRDVLCYFFPRIERVGCVRLGEIK